MLALVLSAALAAPLPDLRLELVRESLTGTHCRLREYVAGLPTDRYVTADCPALTFHSASLEQPAEHAPLRWVENRVARREIREEEPLHPFAFDFDAETGELLRRIPLFFRATKPARVFDPNPVSALNDPSLQDHNDSPTAVPDAAYRSVQLQDVADSGPLRGPYITLVDAQGPAIPPPDAAGLLVFNRADDGFEDVNAYFHIDRNQRYLQSLGYVGRRAVAAYPVTTDAHAQNGIDNSLFLPSAIQPGTGSLYFGVGGTDDAEDADLLVHEYGHAILEWISPATFTGSFTSQARAFSEAFGDYWAFSAHYAQRVASGRDPFCFADWDSRCWTDDASELCAYPPNTDCLRRLDGTKTMSDYETTESPGVEHRNGQIFSSALREIFLAIGKPVTDTIVLESAFGAPSLPPFSVMAQRMIEADRLLYNGAHATAICAAMASRAILRVDQCSIAPRGEWTLFPASDRAIPIPENDANGIVSRLTITDPRVIEKLFVRVDIAHPSRGDLKLELIAPDGTAILLQQSSLDRARDIHVTYGIDAIPAQTLDVLRGRPAAGTWTLRVSDVRPLDVGMLRSWDLVIQFAGDAPSATRPRSARTQMIPVVGRRYGANDTLFVSELRIANVTPLPQTVTLIFTPDGADGRTVFLAVKVSIAPGETIAYDDLVDRVFHASGIGSLEVLGDAIVMSRTYVPVTTGGTVGQTIPPNLETTSQSEPPLIVPQFPLENFRSHLGIVETAGIAGTVRFSIGLELVSVEIPAYGHVQLPVPFHSAYSVSVVSPGTRVAVYLSQVDNTTGDALFVRGERVVAESRTRIAPAADNTGVHASSWRSDLWVASALNVRVSFVDALLGDVLTKTFMGFTYNEAVLPRNFFRGNTFGMLIAQLPPLGLATTRIVNDGTSEYVPFIDPAGAAEQHLLFVERNAAFRTNIGLVANEPATAEVIVYDSAGREMERRVLGTPGGLAQTAVTSRVTNGRAVVRFLAGSGRAYASMVDNRTGDAALILGQ